LTARFNADRVSLPAIVLGSNPASLTANANDYNYNDVFSRELAGLAASGDLLICFSTSGRSENIIRALSTARNMGVSSILFTGHGRIDPEVEHSISVNSNITARIQEIHLIFIHMICEKLDKEYG